MKTHRRLASLAALAALVTTSPAAAQRINADLLVSTAQLASRLNDASTVVLHVGRDRASYDAGHVPGARFLPLSAIVTERDGLPNELPTVAHLDSVFESVGVSDGSRVVLYGDLGGLAAGRAFFTLDYLGHRRAALLDGGLEMWKAEGRPTATDAPAPRRGRLTPRPRPQIVVTADQVAAMRGNPRVALIDARPAAEFAGTEAGAGVGRPGHIPGAKSLFWRTALVSDTRPVLRDPASLRAAFAAAGARPNGTVVTYCRSGVQASHAYFVARYLGYDTKMYDGSFLDWSARTALPVAR
jgi:thiosulfate/3-mercaptopyruvate sulfurtransferase